MRTSGPVTRTLIPMAALDDLVGAFVFFMVIAFVSAHVSTAGVPVGVVIFLVFLPVFIGIATGFLAGKLMQKAKTARGALAVMLLMLLVSAGIGFAINSMLSTPVLNFMLIGMAFSTVFANMISQEKLDGIMKVMNPVIGFALIVAILNLGAPLDYHLIFGAGLYTAVYIVSRAIGKYSGAYFGAAITHAPKTVRNFLGFTLLPHSGVSLVFTGVAVSVLAMPRRNVPLSFRAQLPQPQSSTRLSPCTWRKKALNGPENFRKTAAEKRRGACPHDTGRTPEPKPQKNFGSRHG